MSAPRRSDRRAAAARLSAVLAQLRAAGHPTELAARARFGIPASGGFGVRLPVLRQMARRLGHDHRLALALWRWPSHETRLLAAMVDEPDRVTREQMEAWALAFDSWALCDGVCLDLFRNTPYAWDRAIAWTHRPEEFVRRAGFALIAILAVHDHSASDRRFRSVLRLVEDASDDPRPYVRKAVNWALRQVGKRNRALRSAALQTARHLQRSDHSAARWIATDAIRELRSAPVRERRWQRLTGPATSRRRRSGSRARGTPAAARSTRGGARH